MTPFHPGEIEVQEWAGVRQVAERVGGMLQPLIPEAAQDFLAAQPFLVMSSVDGRGQVWTSVVSGWPGFAEALDERTLRIAPLVSDPKLLENIAVNPEVGLIAIEFDRRYRMRLNGTAQVAGDGTIYIHSKEVFSNCPKYIQARELVSMNGEAQPASVSTGVLLTAEQQDWISQADTFFIGSYRPGTGADASHRGGQPGFVRVPDGNHLVFPDYTGNRMFQTLGNLTANPQAGLLFLDFERGRTLQLTGQAVINWDKEYAAHFAGAERVIEFAISEVVEQAAGLPLGWKFLGYSKFNPAA